MPVVSWIEKISCFWYVASLLAWGGAQTDFERRDTLLSIEPLMVNNLSTLQSYFAATFQI